MVVGQFGSFIDGFLRNYDGAIEEGDIILLNDPYSVEGAISHNNDVLAIAPIFRAGRLIAWSAMFGHMTDVGGRVPGSLPTNAGSIFEEGLRLPPVKLYRRGELQEDIVKIAAHQSRMPEWFKADLHAIVASCRVGARRIVELCDRFTDDMVVGGDAASCLTATSRAMAHLIATAIGEAPVSFEDYVCDDGRGAGPFKHQVHHVAGGRKGGAGFRRHRPAIRLVDQFLPQREHVQDVLRHLHGHGLRPAGDVQRRILRSRGRSHSRRAACSSRVSPPPCPAAPTRSAASSTCSAPCSARKPPNSSAPPDFLPAPI